VTIDVFCNGCGARGEIQRVAARVIHDCGSDDVDLWMGSPEQVRRVAALAGPPPVFSDFMRTAKQPGMPAPGDADRKGYVGDDPVAGWDEYPGPGPQPSGINAPAHTEVDGRVPTKKQPGEVEKSNLYIYDKHDPDPGYGADVPDPLVAKHEYPAPFVTKTPFLGRRKVLKERPTTVPGLPLKGASCPRCGTADTAIVTDDRDHAHWYCAMRLCGSLADLDVHPQTDPWHPGKQAWGQDDFWHGRKVAAAAKDGQLMRRIATVGRTNPGLSLSEVVFLARQSVIQYPEA
jgi:hypothetical protein